MPSGVKDLSLYITLQVVVEGHPGKGNDLKSVLSGQFLKRVSLLVALLAAGAKRPLFLKDNWSARQSIYHILHGYCYIRDIMMQYRNCDDKELSCTSKMSKVETLKLES